MNPSRPNSGFPAAANGKDSLAGHAPGASSPAADPVAAIREVLRHGERFLLCSHSRPDGDAVGSMLAMDMPLAQLGKRADLVTADHIPAIYRGLPGADSIRFTMSIHGPCDAVILLECDGLPRALDEILSPLRESLAHLSSPRGASP